MQKSTGRDPGKAHSDPNRILAYRARSVAQDIFGLTPQDMERSSAAQVLLLACGLVAGTMAKAAGDPAVLEEAASIATAVFEGHIEDAPPGGQPADVAPA